MMPFRVREKIQPVEGLLSDDLTRCAFLSDRCRDRLQGAVENPLRGESAHQGRRHQARGSDLGRKPQAVCDIGRNNIRDAQRRCGALG